MYKIINIISLFILLGIILVLLFSFKNIVGLSIAILYIIIISIIIIISFFSLKKNIYIALTIITIILFTICVLSSLLVYSSYTIPNKFF